MAILNLLKRFSSRRNDRDLDGKKFPEFGEGVSERAKRETYLIRNSRVHQMFQSNKPISRESFLVGREELLLHANRLLQAEGSHVILFGDRGVGKSSVGNVLLDIFERAREGEQLFVYRCNADSQLRDIVAGILLASGRDVNETQVSSKTEMTVKGEAGVNLGIPNLPLPGVTLNSGVTEGVSSEVLSVGDRELANDPSWVAQKIFDIDGLVFVDELDKVSDPTVKHKLSTLVKAISDFRESRLNFVLAGIAQNAVELTAGHPSVQRCLKEIPVEILKTDSLIDIIERGEKDLLSWNGVEWTQLKFDDDVKREIARLSHGYPYFTHLLASNAAQAAILDEKERVTMEILKSAISRAVDGADDELKKSLAAALRGDQSNMFKEVLRSAAEVSANNLSMQELVTAISKRTGNELTHHKVTPYLRRMLGDKENLEDILADIENPKPIFIKVSSGQYRFFDPRMPSYIRLALSGSNDQSSNVPLLEV